jgi:haloalkane dehalogenase
MAAAPGLVAAGARTNASRVTGPTGSAPAPPAAWLVELEEPGAAVAWAEVIEEPGPDEAPTHGILVRAPMVAWCREHVRNLTVEAIGPGSHFVQEDHPEAIGDAVKRWRRRVLAA